VDLIWTFDHEQAPESMMPEALTSGEAPPAGLEPATLRRALAGPQQSTTVHLPGITVRASPCWSSWIHVVL